MVIGLDLATKTGWCLRHDGKILASGVQDFAKRRGESNGLLFLRFRRWLFELVELAPDLELVAYEAAHMRGGAATEILVGLQTHCQSIAAEIQVECAPVHTATLKKFATGSGKASKTDMILAASKIKDGQIADDNEADAILLAKWAEQEYLVF